MTERGIRRNAIGPRSRAWAGLGTILVSLLLAAGPALAAGGGKPATKLVNVADTRAMSGLSRWIADIYNGSLWIYALLVVGSMVFMGLVLGMLSDRVIARLGINLGKLDHHE
jgi:hypothetical protein